MRRTLIPAGLVAIGCVTGPAQVPDRPSYFHYSGLLRVPTAYTAPDGEVRITYGRSWSNAFRHDGVTGTKWHSVGAISHGFLPWAEVGFAGYYFLPERFSFDDRAVSVKASVPLPGGVRVGAGVTDLTGTRKSAAEYVVASAPVGRSNVTLGYGRREFPGLFGGVYHPLSHRLAAMAEFDGKEWLAGLELRNLGPVWAKAGVSERGYVGYAAGVAVPLQGPRKELPAIRTEVLPGPVELLGMMLEDVGFRDVQIAREGALLSVRFTNVRRLDELAAFAQALALGAEFAPRNVERLRIVTLQDRVGVLTLTVDRANHLAFLNGEMEADAFAGMLEIDYGDGFAGVLEWTGRAWTGVDLAIAPRIEYRLGGVGRLPNKESAVFAATRVLGRGWALSGQASLPVNNSLDQDNGLQGERLTLDHTRSAGGVLIRATAGYFGDAGSGAQVEASLPFAEGRGEVFGSGAAVSARGRSNPWEVGGVWREPSLGLTARASYRSFLQGDRGPYVELTRKFDRADVTLFAGQTENLLGNVNYGGALLRFPLGMDRGPTDGPVRVRAADDFPFRYRATQDARPLMGALETLDAQRPLDRDARARDQLHPAYIRANAHRLRWVEGS